MSVQKLVFVTAELVVSTLLSPVADQPVAAAVLFTTAVTGAAPFKTSRPDNMESTSSALLTAQHGMCFGGRSQLPAGCFAATTHVCPRPPMRVCYVFLAATVAILADGAVVLANPVETEDSKLVSGGNSQRRHLRGQMGFLEWPEELEEFIHHHHHVREMLTRWCLEDNEPKEEMEDTREKRNPALEAIYDEVMKNRSHGRKLTVVECNI
ncbi:hypothetical protein PC129_g3692 [Phytophthora cactorum]|uniref:Uncharacterized protein n=1 Tax=Phytophthora cactorum TaxID=29920 RepID=A0A8T1ILQ2_9STRA|nr:hypothetical protein Pcac1_g9031 [Phytophthora cactorum]KAG3225669.1 hypothetical protein PC129_g3692 [Phytophthora cactorum]